MRLVFSMSALLRQVLRFLRAVEARQAAAVRAKWQNINKHKRLMMLRINKICALVAPFNMKNRLNGLKIIVDAIG